MTGGRVVSGSVGTVVGGFVVVTAGFVVVTGNVVVVAPCSLLSYDLPGYLPLIYHPSFVEEQPVRFSKPVSVQYLLKTVSPLLGNVFTFKPLWILLNTS